ncbi:hypothetical protein M9458_056825 [Cirrhinus mrigala]|uniref:DNA-directed DNA polymerase n=1 Tax=Cirrhinus mrigala TaxID=683832 RepID=A0ABD0MGJ3_CIRMR
MRLANTPAAFNLPNAEKGYFPHQFNRPYPAKDFYGYATMSNKDRAEFDEWYSGVSDKVFDFKKELAMYGKNDVVLLREVCMKYRDEFIQCTGLDPWTRAKQSDANVIAFMSTYKHPERLNPHDALFGGRTNAFKLYHKAAEEQQTLPCMHADEERAIHGCWVSIELLKAIEKGYVVVKVDEVWHFPQRSETLFCDYVKTFLQFKQESSGYPKDVVTDGDKESYVRDYFEREGIKLNLDKIELNPARRSIMKLILNSLWGRFCLREGLPTTEIVKDPEQFARHIFGTEHEIRYFSFVSDAVAIVQWSYANGKAAPTRDVNVFLGAFTTAHARLELYDVMERLGDRLLYCDTDSLIYTAKDGEYEPPLGPYLSDLTDEVGPGDHITLFLSAGPKSYGYVTAKGKVCMKVKGITLNAVNSEVITLDSLIGLVDHYVTERDNSLHVLAHNDTIVRNKKNLTLHNKSFVKKFKVVYDKRVLLPDFTTLPYGF